MRFLVPILALVALACGADDPAPNGPAGGGRAGESGGVRGTPVRSVGGSGGPGPEKEPSRDPDLRLTANPPSLGFTPGRPFVVLLTLRNVSRYTFHLYRPEESLRGDLNCMILASDGTKSMVREETSFPEEEIVESQLRELGPDGEIVVQKDIEPMLSRLTTGEAGTYRVQLAFTGGHHGAALSDRVWNRLHMKRVLADAFQIRVAAGGPPTSDEVRRILSETGPDGRLPAASRRRLLDAGDAIWPALAGALELASSPATGEQEAGWAAFELLREIGAPARDVLSGATADPAIQRLLRVWMAIDAAEEGKEPPGADFADQVFDPSTRPLQIFRLTRHTRPGVSETVTVSGEGKVRRQVHSPDGDEVLRGALSGKATEEFLESLVAGIFQDQAGVRKAGREAEALLVFEWAHLEEFDGVWAETPVRRFEVWEEEARLNRPLGDVVRAFEEAGRAAR